MIRRSLRTSLNILVKNGVYGFSDAIKDKETAEEKFYFDKEESILLMK
jgi:hypothetical protein